jgi:hypothetical protein
MESTNNVSNNNASKNNASKTKILNSKNNISKKKLLNSTNNVNNSSNTKTINKETGFSLNLTEYLYAALSTAYLGLIPMIMTQSKVTSEQTKLVNIKQMILALKPQVTIVATLPSSISEHPLYNPNHFSELGFKSITPSQNGGAVLTATNVTNATNVKIAEPQPVLNSPALKISFDDKIELLKKSMELKFQEHYSLLKPKYNSHENTVLIYMAYNMDDKFRHKFLNIKDNSDLKSIVMSMSSVLNKQNITKFIKVKLIEDMLSKIVSDKKYQVKQYADMSKYLNSENSLEINDINKYIVYIMLEEVVYPLVQYILRHDKEGKYKYTTNSVVSNQQSKTNDGGNVSNQLADLLDQRFQCNETRLSQRQKNIEKITKNNSDDNLTKLLTKFIGNYTLDQSKSQNNNTNNEVVEEEEKKNTKVEEANEDKKNNAKVEVAKEENKKNNAKVEVAKEEEVINEEANEEEENEEEKEEKEEENNEENNEENE